MQRHPEFKLARLILAALKYGQSSGCIPSRASRIFTVKNQLEIDASQQCDFPRRVTHAVNRGSFLPELRHLLFKVLLDLVADRFVFLNQIVVRFRILPKMLESKTVSFKEIVEPPWEDRRVQQVPPRRAV